MCFKDYMAMYTHLSGLTEKEVLEKLKKFNLCCEINEKECCRLIVKWIDRIL